MHIITKFLVVLASVLAILLAGLTVAYTANYQRVVEGIASARNAVEAERARASAAENRSAANDAAENQQLQAAKAAAQTAENTVSRLQTELNEARSEMRRLSLEQQRYQSQIDQFLALSDQDKQLRENQQAELRALRDEVNNQARRMIELLDRNSDLVSQLESMENQARAYQEQLAEARREGVSGSASAALPSTFRARVTNVIEDEDGAILVEIDAGSSDRLSEGMELIATRGGRFLGKISLMRVDLNEAVGRLVLTGNGEIRRDDTIQPAA